MRLPSCLAEARMSPPGAWRGRGRWIARAQPGGRSVAVYASIHGPAANAGPRLPLSLDPVGQELLPRPLADSAIRGQVRPGPERPGGPARNAHRDQQPLLSDGAEIAVDQF